MPLASMDSTNESRLKTACSKYWTSGSSNSTPTRLHNLSVASSGDKFSPPNALLSVHSDGFPRNALDDSFLSQVSPSPSSSPQVKDEQDELNKDMGIVVPFSSTPDLGSRASTSSESDSCSQAVKTPPEDNFIHILDRKLRRLVNKMQGNEGRKIRWSDRVQDEELTSRESSCGRSQSLELNDRTRKVAYSHDGAGRTLSSSLSPSDAICQTLKRKRCGSTRDTDIETDADSDSKSKNKSNHASVLFSKKLKETSFTYAVTKTASSRRAHSLSACSSFTSSRSTVPTEPASPTNSIIPVIEKVALSIIAPPDFIDIPRHPLTADDAAEVRLRVLLKKEKTRRCLDGFEGEISGIINESGTQDEIHVFLGIDENFRRKVIQWMLDVTPSKKMRVAELRDQLRSSPETRFHAILLFSRYFMRVGDAMPVATKKETPLMTLGRQRITWDVAVSCLALAVKFNRDFLSPLEPIYAREFLVIAPHPMSHDDFEISQKDVLQALDYEILEITPWQFMEEIWNSLPTLRKLLGFGDGWEVAQVNAWHRLNSAAVACEMFQFPMSLLASAALVEGGLEALVAFYESDTETQVGRELTEQEEVDLEDKAMLAFSSVIEDIKDLMGIIPADLNRCREWLQHMMKTS